MGEPKQRDVDQPLTVTLLETMRFASKTDFALTAVGCICAALSGLILPIFSLVFGRVIDAFLSNDAENKIRGYALDFFIAACSSLILNIGQSTMLTIAAENQGKRMREACLRAVLSQDIGWFDVNNAAELPTRIIGDTILIQEGIGPRLGLTMEALATVVAGFAIGFVRGWRLALIMLIVVPFIAITAGILIFNLEKLSKQTQQLYATAGAVAEQAISSIRTVIAFNGQKKESDRYNDRLELVKTVSIKSGYVISLCLGFIFFFVFSSYAVGLWFGARQVSESIRKFCIDEFNPSCQTGGKVLTVFWSVLVGAVAVGKLGPNMSTIAEARGAASKLWCILDRVPRISSDLQGEIVKEDSFKGKLEFKEVNFSYPSRPDVPILQNLSIIIEPGTTVALVGQSGCGKSTIAALIERFYDPDAGNIYLDQVNLKDLHLKWLRSKIGYVNQEPSLFSGTIKENISCGLTDSTIYDDEALMQKIVEAAKLSQAHEFISNLPEGYNTEVGNKGLQLSGGQKQRIAIARALIDDPHILLFDEATSALDSQSEAQVQTALDSLLEQSSRTTIVIAHKLSTIRNVDTIIFMENGVALEKGTHSELMQAKGRYYRLVKILENKENSTEISDSKIANQNGAESVNHVTVEFEETLSNEDGEIYDLTTPLISKHSEVSHEGKEEEKSVSTWDIICLYKPDWLYFLGALVTSAISGCSFPIISLMLSNIIVIFYESDPDNIDKKSNLIALALLGTALCLGLATFFKILSFTTMSERLAFRLRRDSFRSILHQDIEWFDRKENSSGVLTTRLATEVSQIKTTTGQNLGQHIQNFFTLTTAIGIAFLYGNVRLTIWLLLIFPIVVFAFYIQAGIVSKATTQTQKSYGEAGGMLTESIMNIRSIQALCMEDKTLISFSQNLNDPRKQGIIKGIANGIGLGFAQFISVRY